LPQPASFADENEQQREDRLHRVLLRKLDDAVTEIGRKNVCYALGLTEELLSKQLDQKDRKKPSYRLLAYCLKHEKSGELARWLMVDYVGYLPPQRPELIPPDEAMREVMAMALAGEFGNVGREKVLGIYRRMENPR